MKNISHQQIAVFLNTVTQWASEQPAIEGAALVGSYARNQARPDSDIDLVILTSHPEQFTADSQWLSHFGEPESVKLENYGAVTSWHVQYKNSYEVEFGITSPDWANVPADPGTRKVVTDGIVVLYDPNHLFKKLLT